MKCFDIVSHNPSETRRLGAGIGKLAMPGDILLLVGKLGAGKTCLTQGIARGLGVKGYIASPSFVLIRECQNRLPLYHIDLYRLNNLEEIAELGLDDYLYDQGVCVVEWAEKGLSLMPPEHLLIKIDYFDDNQRRFQFEPHGQRHQTIVDKLKGIKI